MTPEHATIEVPDQVLEFTLGEERYCVAIDAVDEIVRSSAITELPDSPSHVVGMMDLRGETTLVVDPKRIFNTGTGDGADQVVIFDGGESTQVGWLVDRVHKVDDLVDPELDPVEDNRHINGVVSEDDQFTLWVDPDEVNAVTT